MKERAHRGIKENFGTYGGHGPMPSISDWRAETLARLVVTATHLSRQRLKELERVARWALGDSDNDIWSVRGHYRQEVQEVAAVMKALSFEPDAMLEVAEPEPSGQLA